MKLLGVDLETGGMFGGNLEENFITEGGYVVFDTEVGQPVIIRNTLVTPVRPIVPEAVQYTGITTDMAQRYGVGVEVFLTTLFKDMAEADYIVAHNGNAFDRVILESQAKVCGLEMPNRPWIDTMTDVPYPANCVNRNLTYLAGFHKLVNCFPHRAVTDVLTMFEVLNHYDLDEVVQIAKSPTYVVQALVKFETKEKAKAAKFRWDGSNKRWTKDIKACFFENESKSWDFDYKILEE